MFFIVVDFGSMANAAFLRYKFSVIFSLKQTLVRENKRVRESTPPHFANSTLQKEKNYRGRFTLLYEKNISQWRLLSI